MSANDHGQEFGAHRIEPSREGGAVCLHTLWSYRELIYFLAWRDIKLRYKQTWVGAAWAIIQPFGTMVVFSVIFGHFAKMKSAGIPYPLFTFAALLPWQLFSGILLGCSNSLVGNQHLIRKVYFPRAVLPTATVLPALVDFANAFVVFIGIVIYYRMVPSPNIVFLPVFLLLAIAGALSGGIWLSALNARYRDIHHAIPFLLQCWFFATPITYPITMIDEKYRAWFGLNPMVGVIEGFRWSLFGQTEVSWSAIIVSGIAVSGLLFFGLSYFRTVERTLADVV